MSKTLRAFVLVLACLPSLSWAGTTISGSEFYGVWSTANSAFYPKRQILDIRPNGGTWTRIEDDGREEVLNLLGNSVQIDEDLLQVDYRDDESGVRFRLILAGWRLKDKSSIFGTVYLYQNQGDGIQLFNGIPIQFRDGTEQLPPQPFWEFFLGEDTQRVSRADIEGLADSLRRVDGVVISEDDDFVAFNLARIGSDIFLTKQGHAAHPAAIGISVSQAEGSMSVYAKYAGEKSAFDDFYGNFLSDIESAQRAVMEEMDLLFELIEDAESEVENQK